MTGKIRRYKEIMEAAMANMIAKQDKITDFNEGSVIHTILDTVARLAERAYVAIRQGFNTQLEIMPHSIFDMSKKQGQFASGTVFFYRDKPLDSTTIIAKGTRVSDGALFFVTTEAGTIASGAIESDEITIVAEASGVKCNLPPEVINIIDSTVSADVVSVSNKLALTGGSDGETDAQFNARFKAFLNGLSGTNEYAIKYAALKLSSVRSVSLKEHNPPLENIYNLSIYVEDGSGGASEETLEEVKLTIEGDDTELNQGHLAPGINIRVLPPTALPINITINADVIYSDAEQARMEIEKTVLSYVNGLTIGENCLVSEIVARVMGLNFVKDVNVIEPIRNTEVGYNQIARVGTLVVTMAGE